MIRFEDERGWLLPLAQRPYRSVVPVAARQAAPESGGPVVAVERRSLAEYAKTAEAASRKAVSRRDRIEELLADLKMPGALEALADVLARVDGGAATAAEAIEELLAAQIALRNSRRLATAMRSSRLPSVKTLEEYDFAFQPSVKREQIVSLHELGFVAQKENVVFMGPPGVGKTHLAISLAVAAAQGGRRIYYGTRSDLVESLEEARAAGCLKQRLKTLTHPSLLGSTRSATCR